MPDTVPDPVTIQGRRGGLRSNDVSEERNTVGNMKGEGLGVMHANPLC